MEDLLLHYYAQKLHEFAMILVAADAILTIQELLDFIERPWVWRPEYEMWKSFGSPTFEDGGDSWQTFCTIVNL